MTFIGGNLQTVLIHTPCHELQDDRLEPPLGLLYIAAWLECHGHQVKIVDLSSMPIPQGLADIERADVFGFSTYTPTYHRTLEIMRELRRAHPKARMVAGGPHASSLPASVLRDFDHVVVGEGEMALLKIVRALERGERLPPVIEEPAIEVLDGLPFPDYELVDVHSYRRVVNGHRSLSVLSSRGCSYRCAFCNSVVMGRSHKVRFRSARNVADEIVAMKERWGVNAFRFQDDTFTLKRDRLREIARYLRRENISYRCFARVDHCKREITDALYESGCRHVSLGVESGAPQILKRMNKDQTVEDIRWGIHNAKESGLTVRVFLLVGFPGETWQTLQATIDLMLDLTPDEYSVYPVIPYPGTPLYDTPEQFGITYIDKDFSKYFQVANGRKAGYVFRTNDLDEREVEAMREHLIRSLEPQVRWAGSSTLNR